MNPKTLIIYEYQILYKILSEIKEYLNFEILEVDKEQFKDLEFDKFFGWDNGRGVLFIWSLYSKNFDISTTILSTL